MKAYAGKRVVVTGGLGFIGSNLSIRLVEMGADVTIVDSRVAGCGANYRNVEAVASKLKVIETDIGDCARMQHVLKRTDVVFNLAGEISHTHSMEFPERDLKINTRSQMSFLEEYGKQVPGIRVVFAGTRQVYGKPEYLPVNEAHPVAPVDYNGVHKHAAEQYHLMLARMGVLDSVVLRLTNIYGPRLAIQVPCQGVMSRFFLNLALGQPLQVFGDGTQLRDPLYVDDAVTAILLAGSIKRLESRVYNVGGSEALSLAEIGKILCRLAGAAAPTLRPFPPDRIRIDIGSFVSDSTLIGRELGWVPATLFEDGAAATLEFFRAHLREYVDPSGPYPTCHLRQPHLARKAVSE